MRTGSRFGDRVNELDVRKFSSNALFSGASPFDAVDPAPSGEVSRASAWKGAAAWAGSGDQPLAQIPRDFRGKLLCQRPL